MNTPHRTFSTTLRAAATFPPRSSAPARPRRDFGEGSSNRFHFPLSLDITTKELIELFCDYDTRRCKLCNETYVQWHVHQQSIPHAGRESLMLEMLRAHNGTPEVVVQRWWQRLHTSPMFERLPVLSHATSHGRLKRLQYLLRVLRDHQILLETFDVGKGACGTGNVSAQRTWQFERLEFTGDNVIKYLFNNRIHCLFPPDEIGLRGRLGYLQFVIDGNDGLARGYDYLELERLTNTDRVVSKFKSDVVETLFGELQFYIWSTELQCDTARVSFPFVTGMHTIRALVKHVMEEVAHVLFIYHIEYVLGALRCIVREHQLEFTKAEAVAAGGASRGGNASPVHASPVVLPGSNGNGNANHTQLTTPSHLGLSKVKLSRTLRPLRKGGAAAGAAGHGGTGGGAAMQGRIDFMSYHTRRDGEDVYTTHTNDCADNTDSHPAGTDGNSCRAARHAVNASATACLLGAADEHSKSRDAERAVQTSAETTGGVLDETPMTQRGNRRRIASTAARTSSSVALTAATCEDVVDLLYMPHLQQVAALSARVPVDWAARLDCELCAISSPRSHRKDNSSTGMEQTAKNALTGTSHAIPGGKEASMGEMVESTAYPDWCATPQSRAFSTTTISPHTLRQCRLLSQLGMCS